MATGVLRAEFVKDGMIGTAFVPRFTLGLFGGIGASWWPETFPLPSDGPYPMKPFLVLRGGLHLGLTTSR